MEWNKIYYKIERKAKSICHLCKNNYCEATIVKKTVINTFVSTYKATVVDLSIFITTILL